MLDTGRGHSDPSTTTKKGKGKVYIYIYIRIEGEREKEKAHPTLTKPPKVDAPRPPRLEKSKYFPSLLTLRLPHSLRSLAVG